MEQRVETLRRNLVDSMESNREKDVILTVWSQILTTRFYYIRSHTCLWIGRWCSIRSISFEIDPFCSYMGDTGNVSWGGDFWRAYQEYQTVKGCRINLGDSSIRITLLRAIRSISFWQKWIWFFSFPSNALFTPKRS